MSQPTADDVFSRHYLLPEIGRDGQARLLRAHVALVGVGAVGSRIAELLCRAGVGRLTLVDSDAVEFSNLHRQTLYTWQDAERSVPKAEAARRQLNCVMPTVQVFPHVARLDITNVGDLLKGADVVADGTDNIETRYVVNDWCVMHDVPWVYAGAVGTKASVFPVRGKNACLRCAFPSPPDRKSLPTAADAGVIGAATAIAAARASTLVMRFILNDPPEPVWETWDVWTGGCSSLPLESLRRAHGNGNCPLCSG